MSLECTIDSSGLERAIALAQVYSKRMPAELCNSACLEIAIGAKNNMPVTTIQKVDYELDTIVTPVIGKRGKPLKNKKIFGAGGNSGFNFASGKNVPFAALLIQARARKGSRYNLLTNGRYALPSSPFKGVSRAIGQSAMAQAVHKMIASRHSSVAFLKAGWIPAIKTMLPFTANRWRGNGGSKMEGGRYYGKDLGGASPATPGTLSATASISNDIGYTGKNAESFDRALQTKGGPGLQAAIDKEGVNQINYYLRKSGSELEINFNKAAS